MNKPMRFPKHKTFWITLLLALIAIPLYHALETYRSRGKEKAVGIYLVHGGQSFVWIDLDEDGELVVRDGYFYTHGDFYSKLEDISFSAIFRDGNLILEQEEEEHSRTYSIEGRLQLSLQPSEIAEGDWDLARAHFRRAYSDPWSWTGPGGWTRGGPFTKEFYEGLWAYFKARLGIVEEEITGRLGESDPALLSFLHRVDDERLVSYMKKRLEGKFKRADVDQLRTLAAAFPEDPYIQMHAMEVEANHGDPEVAVSLTKEWRERFEESPDVLLSEISQRAVKAVWKATGDPRGDDLMETLLEIDSIENDLDERLAILEELSSRKFLVTTSHPVVETSGGSASELYDYLGLQVLARIFAASADLDLIAGNRDSSLGTMGAVYRLGETLNSDGPVIQRLIGIALRLIAQSRIERQLVNACETEDEIRRFWSFLETLNSEAGLPASSKLLEDDWPPFLERLDIVLRGGFIPVWRSEEEREREFRLRNDVSNTRHQLMVTGTAAKLRHFLSGQYPKLASEFAPLLPDGPPLDVFSGEPIRFIEEPNGDYSVYSVGPDEEDDSAMVSYSPTNGSTSNGDLILEFEREREYPFPSEGLFADSATEVLEIFHKGLPHDPFAGSGSVGYSVYNWTGETPVRVFSFGPSGDMLRYYSNTEGFFQSDLSRVDIGSPTESRNLGNTQWVFLPPTGIEVIDYATRVVREVDMSTVKFFSSEDVKWVEKERTLTPFTLGPRYSPTNGIKSEGQIWIDLPRRTGRE